ncbi:hypothetical protein LXL04_038127 [Taraxacum kok-saghyz]
MESWVHIITHFWTGCRDPANDPKPPDSKSFRSKTPNRRFGVVAATLHQRSAITLHRWSLPPFSSRLLQPARLQPPVIFIFARWSLPRLQTLPLQKLAASCVNTIGEDGNPVGSPEKEATEMDMPDSDEEGIGVDFAVHNPMMKWSLMKPTKKEIYESPKQLRFALTNYAVAYGYPLRFTRCDKKRIQVKCGKGEDGKTCPFVLWASWMGRERSFKIKKLVEKHICVRSFDFGSIVNPDWLAKHYMKDFIVRPNLKVLEFKADVEKRFFCKVSKGQCRRAKIKAQTLIEGKISDHYARLWDHAHEIRKSNPGSTVQIGVNVNPDGNYFHRFYIL